MHPPGDRRVALDLLLPLIRGERAFREWEESFLTDLEQSPDRLWLVGEFSKGSNHLAVTGRVAPPGSAWLVDCTLISPGRCKGSKMPLPLSWPVGRLVGLLLSGAASARTLPFTGTIRFQVGAGALPSRDLSASRTDPARGRRPRHGSPASCRWSRPPSSRSRWDPSRSCPSSRGSRCTSSPSRARSCCSARG